MKKLKVIIGALLMGALVFACSSDDDNNNNDLTCEEATEASLNAGIAFNAATPDNYEARCNAYKDALQDQIDVCGDESGDLQDIIDDLGDCTLDAVSGVISVNAGITRTFETNITVTTTGTTRHITAYDNASSDWVSFDIEEGDTGADAIANFTIHLLSSDYNPLPDDEGGNWSSNISTNSATAIEGTFFGIVTSPTTGADVDLTSGVIDLNL